MVINADIVGREATRPTRHGLHPVLRWISVAWTGKFWKVTAQGHAAPSTHQRRGLDALLWRDKVNGPNLVVLPPASPIPTFMQLGEHFLACGYASFCHGVLLLR